MAETIVMIALSPTMNEGLIAEWKLQEGESFKSGDALCEVETDKATMTYEAPAAGTLLKILMKAGSQAQVGQAIAVYGKPGEDWQSAPGATTQAASNIPVDKPSTAAAQVPALPELPPALPKPAAEVAAVNRGTPETQANSAIRGQTPTLPSGIPPSSPLARKLANQAGVDLRTINGSGPNGRVVARDLAQAQRPGQQPASAPKAAASTAAAGRTEADRIVPLSRMRSIIAERLGESYRTAPHYYVRMAIEMDRLLGLRAQLNQGREAKLSLNAFIIKLTAAALKQHPQLYSIWQGDSIRYPSTVDIGLAVALDKGLVTPVLRDCAAFGIQGIDTALTDLVERGRAGTLQPQEYSDANFTISNLGAYGVEEFTAIINPPGSAILAIGGIKKEAIVRDDNITSASILHATLSADHRSIDGAVAAAFMVTLKQLFEEPAAALL